MKACARCESTRCDSSWLCLDCGFQPTEIDGFTAFAPDIAEQSDGFRRDLYGRLATLEAANFWFVARNRLIAWAIAKYFPDARNVHEVGCGTGFVLESIRRVLPAARLSGSEPLIGGLQYAVRRVPTTDLFQLDARRMPFSEEFDLIGAFDVVEHIDEDEAVLRQFGRALTDRGGLILTVPQHPFLWSRLDELALHRRRYTAAGLARKVRAAGFEIIRATSFVSLLLPAMAISRRFPVHEAAEDAFSALQPPPSINLAMGHAMTLERSLIQLGVSFPIGGSRLLVARRVHD